MTPPSTARPTTPRGPAGAPVPSGTRATLSRLLRRFAAILPPPRDEALIATGRGIWSLLRGQPVQPLRGGRTAAIQQPIDYGALNRAISAVEAADYETAIGLAEEILAQSPKSYRALQVLRDAHKLRGDLQGTAITLSKMRDLRDEPHLATYHRVALGRLIETDPRWLPTVAGPVRPVTPRHPRSVMHLLKESLPYRQNGFTMRSRYTLLSQRNAGLEPFVVTSLGFPRKDGFESFPDMELVDGIPHHRLDLGPGYPEVFAFDKHLVDYAWLAARVARREAPAVIHASSGFRGYETALVGLALRDHIRRPMIYEVRSFFEATWTADATVGEQGEHFERRFETENRCMQAADVVITIGESMRDEIVSRGVPRDRIHLLPNAVDAEAFRPMQPDPRLRRRYRLDGKTVFGYVSTLDHPREGQELLIEATSHLLRRGRDVACLIVGDGDRREELEGLAAHAGVSAAVHFTGRVPHDEVRAHYALLDIFVVPRRDDRAARLVTPLKPFEALAMAKPLVVADLPALVEIAAPGERGLAFQPEDAASLADQIEILMDHPEQAAAFGEAGRAWVQAERTWNRNGERYREIVDELLERWDHPSRAADPSAATAVAQAAR